MKAVICSLLISSCLAATPGVTLSGTVSAPTNYPRAITGSSASTGQTFALYGYACIRQGWTYVFPMVSSGNVVGGS